MSNNLPLVSISCITYNHAPYIRKCLDGFLMQKTNFHYEVLIHDDASTDGTADIIREYEIKYPDIIKPIYQKENQYSKGIKISQTYNFPRAQGKYIAFCEGDDYWTDPNKLQMQVDFLENNPDYGMCYTKAKQYDQSEKYFIRPIGSKIASFNDLLRNGNRIPTLTVCIRKFLLLQYLNDIKPETKNWLLGDYPMWLWVAHESKIHFYSQKTSVYRVLTQSASHNPNPTKELDFCKSCYSVRRFFADKYMISIENFDENINFFYIYLKRYLKRKSKDDLVKFNEFYSKIAKKNWKHKIYFFLLNFKIFNKLLKSRF